MHQLLHHQPRLHTGHRPATAALTLGSTLIAALFVGACASMPPPTSEVAVANAAVAHAAGAGAPALAPQEMRMARDKLASANAAMASEDYAKARPLAEQALAEAQLAEAKAEALKSRKAADDARQANGVLRDEMNRKMPNPQ
jgi:Domain of unknown function (DUF4398)